MPRQAGKQCRCSDQRLVPRVGMVGHLHLLLGHGDAISSAIAMPYHLATLAAIRARKRRRATQFLHCKWHGGQRQEQKLRSGNPAQTIVQLSNHATAILGEYTSEARTSSLHAYQCPRMGLQKRAMSTLGMGEQFVLSKIVVIVLEHRFWEVQS